MNNKQILTRGIYTALQIRVVLCFCIHTYIILYISMNMMKKLKRYSVTCKRDTAFQYTNLKRYRPQANFFVCLFVLDIRKLKKVRAAGGFCLFLFSLLVDQVGLQHNRSRPFHTRRWHFHLNSKNRQAGCQPVLLLQNAREVNNHQFFAKLSSDHVKGAEFCTKDDNRGSHYL